MRAIRVEQTGGPEVLRLESVEVPEPGPGELLMQVEAAGVNFVDCYRRSGLYPVPLPNTPGSEAAGVVAAVGSEVTAFEVGDRVASASARGTYAEYALVPVGGAVAVPGDVEARAAAAVLLQGLTAHYLATTTFPLETGHVALVHAAAGGVGQLLVQIAKRRGARVLATVSTDEKADLARAAGADDVLRYDRVDVAAQVWALAGGAHVVFDSVGRDTFAGSLDSLRPRGTLVLYGQASGPVGPFDPQVLMTKGSLFLTRPTLHDYTGDPQELRARAAELFAWLAARELSVRVDRTWPLEQASAAHRYMEDRQTKGKILLLP